MEVRGKGEGCICITIHIPSKLVNVNNFKRNKVHCDVRIDVTDFSKINVAVRKEQK